MSNYTKTNVIFLKNYRVVLMSLNPILRSSIQKILNNKKENFNHIKNILFKCILYSFIIYILTFFG